MERIDIDAKVENLQDVNVFLESNLEKWDCPMKTQMQICIAVEEIFVNIASYAYGDKVGRAVITMEFIPDENAVSITFEDEGIPYNPLEKEDPDVTLSAEQRSIGGLGIYMVKKSMDDMTYKYENNKNILTIKKIF